MYEEPLKRKNNTLVCHSRESGNIGEATIDHL